MGGCGGAQPAITSTISYRQAFDNWGHRVAKKTGAPVPRTRRLTPPDYLTPFGFLLGSYRIMFVPAYPNVSPELSSSALMARWTESSGTWK
jgi:hypothetical protein